MGTEVDADSPPPAKPEGAYRVLHTADWHLGKTLRDLSREEEHARFLEFLLGQITAAEVDLLIIAGDIFDSANPPQSAQALYFEFLSRLFRESECHALIVGGNHDSPSQLEAPGKVLSALRTRVVGSAIDPPEEAVLLFPDAGAPKLAVAAIPFLRDRDLRSGVAGQGAEDIRRALVEGIRARYAAAAQFNTTLPLIATGHLTVAGSSASDSERDIHIGGLGAVGAELFDERFQYVALGHLHRPQSCGGSQRVRYAGSPIPLSFSEASDHKQVRLLDFEDGKLTNQQALPVPLSRPLLQLRCKRAEVGERLGRIDPPTSELTAWVELVIEDPVAGEEIMETARAAAEGKPFEIVQVIAARVGEGHGDTGNEAISDLESDALLRDPRQVFERRLEREAGLLDAERKALQLAFTELLEQGDAS